MKVPYFKLGREGQTAFWRSMQREARWHSRRLDRGALLGAWRLGSGRVPDHLRCAPHSGHRRGP
jgi:hypothetical protein